MRDPDDWWTVPTYPGGSINVEAAAMEPDAVNTFGAEKNDPGAGADACTRNLRTTYAGMCEPLE